MKFSPIRTLVLQEFVLFFRQVGFGKANKKALVRVPVYLYIRGLDEATHSSTSQGALQENGLSQYNRVKSTA